MRAAVFSRNGGPEVMEIREMDTPVPGPAEVRIEVHATAINHLDLWARRGLPFDIPMPHIGGSDIAGVVGLTGSDVDKSILGSRVVVNPSLNYEWYESRDSGLFSDKRSFQVLGEHTQGGMAEHCIVPARNLMKIPDNISFELAAAAPVAYVTAWHALIGRGRLCPGESVLITGASGGVSSAAIQIAKLMGAIVYAVTKGSEKVTRVKALGADYVYDRNLVDFSKELWRDTEKRGVDVVLDSVGEPMWQDCLRSMGQGGRLLVFGGTGGPVVTSDVRSIFWKQLSIIGCTMGTPREFERVMRLVFDGKLRPPIHDVIPLDQIRVAHDMLEMGEVFGKLVLIP
jgi:NADPH:quinone reductase-like Zn-dependent oxidoreductase